MQQGLIVCGGEGFGSINTNKSCVSLSDQGWSQSHKLLHARDVAFSWTSDSGVMIMGGEEETTTEILQSDGSSQPSFNIIMDEDDCVIELEDSFVVVGRDMVKQYDSNGFVRNLPQPNMTIFKPGCGYYQDEDMNTVNT